MSKAPLPEGSSSLASVREEDSDNLPSSRKLASRRRLLGAAAHRFLQDGYFAVSVDDIAKSAGVSRMTFYRHFSDKSDLAIQLFQQESEKSKPRFLQIAEQDYSDPHVVNAWLTELFQSDQNNRGLLRVFTQITAEDMGFTRKAQSLITNLITALGDNIPAFRLQENRREHRRRWLEAWLLIYEILDQSNHAALQSGVADDPLVIDILASRFVRFVSDEPAKH